MQLTMRELCKNSRCENNAFWSTVAGFLLHLYLRIFFWNKQSHNPQNCDNEFYDYNFL